jgi:hypothetical protein
MWIVLMPEVDGDLTKVRQRPDVHRFLRKVPLTGNHSAENSTATEALIALSEEQQPGCRDPDQVRRCRAAAIRGCFHPGGQVHDTGGALRWPLLCISKYVMKTTSPFPLAALLLLAGCGTSIRYTALNHPPRRLSPRPAEAVRVYTSAKPDQPYMDVGLLEASQESGFSLDETKEIIASLRQRAGQMGCDALIINGTSHKAGVAESVLLDINVDLKGVQATCAVYTNGQPQ